MSTHVTLGIDIGTGGARVLAVTPDGKVVAEAKRSYELLTPQPGWTEQRPTDWAEAALGALGDVAGQLDDDQEPAGIGLSGQMHGLVPLDGDGEPVRPAILWNDQRTEEAVEEMEATFAEGTLAQRTGSPPITSFQLPKLLWMRANEPDAYARVQRVLLPKDYIGYVLTGAMAAEPTDASGTNCFNLDARDWDEDVLDAVNVSPDLFPRVVASHEQTGALHAEAAQQTGLPEGLPVVAGAGDNAAAAVGLGLSSKNMQRGSVSLGTSGVIFAPLKEARPDPEGRVHLFCHADGGYHLLAVTLSAAGSLRWYRDTFAPEAEFDALLRQAGESTPGAGGVTFHPYLSGERTPYMDPNLRGRWSGMSLATTQAEMVRSIVEGVAFSLRDSLDVIEETTTLGEAFATGGGAQSDLWLQIVADVLRIPLHRMEQTQGAAYGAALLALQGVGLVDDAVAAASTTTARQFTPGGVQDYGDALARYRAAMPATE